jgi:hypothetical protein
MPFDFPSSPTVGQKYPQPPVSGQPVYNWDGEKWTTIGGTINPGIGIAASFDAMAYNGMQVNGGMEVDQRKSGAATTFAAGVGGRNPTIDGWDSTNGSNAAYTIQQVASVFPGYAKELKYTVTTAQATIGSSYIDLQTMIEGSRLARAGWGTPAAQPVSIGFWVKSSVAGAFTVFATNFDSTAVVGPSATPPIAAANVAQWITGTIAAQTTGNWKTDNTVGLNIVLRVAGASQMNIAATVGNTFEITGFVVLAGSQLPSAAQAPLVMRPYEQELQICRRYFRRFNFALNQLITVLQAYSTANANGPLLTFTPQMRAVPTASYSSTVDFIGQVAAGGGGGFSSFGFGLTLDAVWFTSVTGSVAFAAGNAVAFYSNSATAWMQFDARL